MNIKQFALITAIATTMIGNATVNFPISMKPSDQKRLYSLATLYQPTKNPAITCQGIKMLTEKLPGNTQDQNKSDAYKQYIQRKKDFLKVFTLKDRYNPTDLVTTMKNEKANITEQHMFLDSIFPDNILPTK